MSSPLPTLLHDSTAAPHPAVSAEVMDQLSHTVRQLLLAALTRAPELHPVPAPPPLAAQRPHAVAPLPLSAREREVLQHIAAGDSNKMIARALDLSPHTVKRHVANILDKLDLRSRGQAAAWWMARQPQRPLGH